MNILFVASECAPFVKTGGLADVIGALPKALGQLGHSVRILLPAYPALDAVKDSGVCVISR
ncbi:MAG: glycogen/starch synthase, partial [Pseudomonadota bacterium]